MNFIHKAAVFVHKWVTFVHKPVNFAHKTLTFVHKGPSALNYEGNPIKKHKENHKENDSLWFYSFYFHDSIAFVSNEANTFAPLGFKCTPSGEKYEL